jgi:hypothetical protein
MAEWRTVSAGCGEIRKKVKHKTVHYLNELNTAAGLQNMGCHRDIIKQRIIDFAKAVAGCS